MRPNIIHDLPEWQVTSWGNGLAYELLCKPDRLSVYFQGDDADQFRDELVTLTSGLRSMSYTDALSCIWSDVRNHKKGFKMAEIYPLPEKPTAQQIIERSIAAHPTMFADMLRDRANTDFRYARDATNPLVTRGATAGGRAAMASYNMVKDHGDDPHGCAGLICAHCGTMVVALNIACKLQCLPPHIRTQAVVDWDERQAKG